MCLTLFGASVSEPHTCLFNCDFSYIIYYLSYVVPYILNDTLPQGCWEGGSPRIILGLPILLQRTGDTLPQGY